MARERLDFLCSECGAGYSKWQGQCPGCEAWNSIEAAPAGLAVSVSKSRKRTVGYAGTAAEVLKLSEVNLDDMPRLATGSDEFDRVLGGGLMPGSVVLVGGDPGIGKSTLLLQTLCRMGRASANRPCYCRRSAAWEPTTRRSTSPARSRHSR